MAAGWTTQEGRAASRELDQSNRDTVPPDLTAGARTSAFILILSFLRESRCTVPARRPHKLSAT